MSARDDAEDSPGRKRGLFLTAAAIGGILAVLGVGVGGVTLALYSFRALSRDLEQGFGR